MIHDAKVEVTCDGKGCRESVCIELTAGARGVYLCDDNEIERRLGRDHEWTLQDGKHYCSPHCAGTD